MTILEADFRRVHWQKSGLKVELAETLPLLLPELIIRENDHMKFLLGVETITTINDGGLGIRYIQGRRPVKWQPGGIRPVLSIEARLLSISPDTTTGLKLYGAMQKRKHVVWISRLHTGHCHLNEYLHRFKIIETSECECGARKETVEHFLLNCELYDEERDKFRRKVGAQGMRTSVLLGDSTIIKDTIEYIESTGRFKLEQG